MLRRGATKCTAWNEVQIFTVIIYIDVSEVTLTTHSAIIMRIWFYLPVCSLSQKILAELNPIWHAKMFLTTVLKRFEVGSWNFVTFNITLCSIKKYIFLFPRMSGVTIATTLLRSIWDFLNLSCHMFPYNEILKVLKSKIWLDIWN